MRNLLVTTAILFSAVTTAYGQGGVAIFQDGRDGYFKTQDVELNAEFNTPPGTGLGDEPSISVDESNGGFPTQGGLRFDDIFEGQGGTVPYDQIPLDVDIFFAEIRVVATSQTASDAQITFNRVLGPDQNRLAGTPGSVWNETDTWFSLGGDQTVENGALEEKPIEVGLSTTLGPNNEAVSALLNGFDPVTGEQYGVLSEDQNTLDFDGEDLATGAASINVTDTLQLWQANPSQNFGWAISSNSTNGWDFRSSEFTTGDGSDPNEGFEFRPLLLVAYGVAGDIDLDGDIDGLDYQILRDNLGNSSIFRGEPGDLNYDKVVDLNDFFLFKDAYETANPGLSFAALVNGTNVPEPSTVALAALALLAFCVSRNQSRG